MKEQISAVLRHQPRNGDTEEKLHLLVRTYLQSVSLSKLNKF
jgi:hypothetical protein